ncbi:MAG TPA: hypothetical protein VME18_07730 [Acidobacteriaceae bacterium]|nr:hypothetical protein [Acidobacteriaceae bacterium]
MDLPERDKGRGRARAERVKKATAVLSNIFTGIGPGEAEVQLAGALIRRERMAHAAGARAETVDEPGNALERGRADDFDARLDDAHWLLGANFVEAFALFRALNEKTAARGLEATLDQQRVNCPDVCRSGGMC